MSLHTCVQVNIRDFLLRLPLRNAIINEEVKAVLKALWHRFREQYIVNQVQQFEIPDFPPDRVCRYRVVFSGRVQGVGFRFETWQLAGRLGICGYCENLSSGDVLAEFQGEENRILFLISALESVRRFVIAHKALEEIPVQENASGFDCR